jgi:hypothetical protein
VTGGGNQTITNQGDKTMSNPFTITAAGLTEHGITFTPANLANDGTRPVANVRLLAADDSVEVEVTADAVLITSEGTHPEGRWITSTVRTTLRYECPVTIRTCLPDFSVVKDVDHYVPSPGVWDYGMFSDDGNLAVMNAVLAAVDAGVTTTADEVCATAGAAGDFPEVMDTVVREYVHAALLAAGLIAEVAS